MERVSLDFSLREITNTSWARWLRQKGAGLCNVGDMAMGQL
jgi:hypothetical protein